MSKEKTLDEALDEFDRWGEQVSQAIAHKSPEEVAEYFKHAQTRLEKRTGKRLNLPAASCQPATPA